MLGRRTLSFGQLLLAAGLGVAGGVYIYQPIFQGGPRAGGPAPDPPPQQQEEKPPPGTRLG